jgi:hypothetical protein
MAETLQQVTPEDAALIDAALEGQPEAVLKVSRRLIQQGKQREAATLRQITGVTGGRLPTKRTALDAMRETGVRPIPVVSALDSAADLGPLWAASRRMEAGTGTDEDEKLVLGWLADEERKEKRGATTGYYAMRILTELPAFAGEFIATGGLYTAGKVAARKAIRQGAGAAVRKSVERVVGRTAASLAVRAVGATSGAALQASANVPRIVGATLQRAMPTWAVGEDETGEAALVLVEAGKSFAQALPAGYADTLIEYVSERAGGAITHIPGVSRLVALQGRVLERIAGGDKGKLGQLLKQVGSGAGWHGVIGEMGEERFAAVLRAVVLDDPWEDVFPPAEQLLGEAAAFAVPGVGSAVAQRVAGKAKAGAAPRQGGEAPVEADESVPAPSPERVRAREQAVESYLGELGRPGEVQGPSSPIQKAISRAVAERGGEAVFVRPTDDPARPFGLPAMTDPRSGVLVFDASARPEDMQRGYVRHEVLAHLLKGQDPAAWQSLYDEVRASDPGGIAEQEASYAADFARATGRALDPAALPEEGLGRQVEALSRWMDAVQANPGRVEALMEHAEGRSFLTRLLEALKRALSRFTGGKVQSARQELDALGALLGGTEGMAVVDRARVAGALNEAWAAMVGAPLPANVSEAPNGSVLEAKPVPRGTPPVATPETEAVLARPRPSVVRPAPSEPSATREQPVSPVLASPLTTNQRRLAERRANKLRGKAAELRAAPARNAEEAREQLRRARELEARAVKASPEPVSRRPVESRQAMAERLAEEGRESDIRFAASPQADGTGGNMEIGSLDSKQPQAVSSVRSWLRRNLASRGNMPEAAFRALIERDARVAVAMQSIRYGIRDFRVAARKLYGSKVPYDVLDRALKDPEAMTALPEGIRGPLAAMRADIDALSRALIDSGAVDGPLVARIKDNVGFYATRSYRVFDDPKWAEKVPVEVRNKAKALLRNEYLGRARRARERALEAPERAGQLEAIAQEMEARASDERLEGQIGSMLYEGKAAQSMFGLLAGSKVGSKDLSILKRRRDIAPEIRALFGEYADPTVNYARSVSKMGHLIANHQFLAEVRESGLRDGFLTLEPVGRNVARIAADESQVMFPLNGLYTTVEIEQAFRDLDREQMPEWLRLYLRVNGAVKYSKTVGSVITQVRNFTGNLGFVLANGHYRIGKSRDAFRAVLTRFAGDDKAWRERYQDALRYGVIHESANAGELRDVLQDAARRDIDSMLLTQASPALKGIGFLTDVYQANDDFWKLYAWQNEMDSYRQAHPEWPEEQLKRHTAGIVRNTFPTYSLVPRMVKKLRRFPLVGSFVSFPSEVVRTAKNTIGLAALELRDERTRAIGARRVVGMVMAATSTAAAAAASRLLMGMSGDDDEDARQFVPPWSKNSDLVWVGRGKGKNPLYVDVSYTDPYSYLKSPLKAFLRGEDWQEKVVGALGEATEPWIGEEILAGGILDVLRNKKSRGGEVYNEGADATTQAQEIVEHLWQSLQPGTVGSIQRIHRGLTGRVTPYGKAYDPKIEALATLSGVRLTELDVAQSLRFRASDFQRQMSNATRMLSSVTKRAGKVSEGEIESAYSSLEESRERHFRAMRRAVEAAQALGLSRQEIVRELRGSLSAENTSALLRNRYRPYKPARVGNERDRQVGLLYRARMLEDRR